MKRTCLYKSHIKSNGHMVDFAGFEMPLYYKGILQEHKATRETVGMFDVSHMGKFNVSGEEALKSLDYLITNNLYSLVDGQVLYTPMCYEDGGVIDDILIYRNSSTSFFVVVNAANIDKDFQWMQEHLEESVKLTDITSTLCQIAIQGPKAESLVSKLTSENLKEIEYYWFKDDVLLDGVPMLISRTGYTGEDGFELYFDKKYADQIWSVFLEKGDSIGIKACGLGARDTLRFEAGMPLYGNEISSDINPIEAGLIYFIKLDEEDFIGKEALKNYKNNRQRKIVGFKLIDKGLSRSENQVLDLAGNDIGIVTTGYKSPTFGSSLGFALIKYDYNKKEILLQVRNKQLKGMIIPKRFLKTYK